MHVLSSLSMDQIVSKQFAPLRQQLTSHFSKYPPSVVHRTAFDSELKTLFQESFSTPLPLSIEQQALNEKKLIQSIRYQLKKDNLILRRTVDQNNVYYLGCASTFERKANDYMTNTTSYEMIGIMNENNPQQLQLQGMIKSIDLILEKLFQTKRISKDHLMKMCVKKSNIQLPYLYFLPELQQHGDISLQPMISSSKHCLIQPLARYLNELLQPLYDCYAQLTTLSNGADFIRKLLEYEKDGLRPTTRFVTLKINNFYNMIPYDGITEALGQFLSDVLVTGRRDNLSIDIIQQLTELVLYNNLFTYNGKIYRHLKGSPLSLPLTRILGNIYLYEWQRPLIRKLSENREFYGRFHDNIFLSWNGSDQMLQSLLDELNRKHSDIRFTTTMGSSVDFLGAFIENRKDYLYTRVYHSSYSRPFILPYVIGHPRLIYRQWFRWALIRAVYYCKLVEDFDQERLNIELAFLVNEYSFDFIKHNLQQFFNEFGTIIHSGNLNQTHYEQLRLRILQRVEHEKQDVVQQQRWNVKQISIDLYYLYDWGPRYEFNKKFNLLWYKHFEKDLKLSNIEIKPKLRTRHCYTSNALLARQVPSSHRINN